MAERRLASSQRPRPGADRDSRPYAGAAGYARRGHRTERRLGAADEGPAEPACGMRVREGYDLRQVVAEYRALRRVIHELYSISGTFHAEQLPAMQALTVMDTAVDAAIVDAVDQYAVDREKSRDMFIGMLGHDLRDPLNTIMFGIASLVEKYAEELPAPAVKIAVRVSTSASRMERMIRDLLDFAHGRLGSGLPVVPAPIPDARMLIADTVPEIAHAN